MSKGQVSSLSTSTEKSYQLKKYCTLAILTALAFLCVVLFKVPVIGFLTYEPKDVIIVLASFIFGPISGIIVSVVVCVIEMITISSTGPIGLIMNILSTICFVLPSAIFYKKSTSRKSIIIGLAIGGFATLIAMLLWNFLITPIYMGIPRDDVVKMLLPVFIPFNLIKALINGTIVILLLPVLDVLRKANLIPRLSISTKIDKPKSKNNLLIVITSIVILATCVLLVLVLNGTI